MVNKEYLYKLYDFVDFLETAYLQINYHSKESSCIVIRQVGVGDPFIFDCSVSYRGYKLKEQWEGLVESVIKSYNDHADRYGKDRYGGEDE